jgi:hypothetical protein
MVKNIFDTVIDEISDLVDKQIIEVQDKGIVVKVSKTCQSIALANEPYLFLAGNSSRRRVWSQQIPTR